MKPTENPIDMKIYLPHLHYTIFVKVFTKKPPQLLHAKAYTEHTDSNTCTLFLEKKRESPGDVAHELIHVLQFICEDRDMIFTLEREHMAYLMHYLMGKILGYEWK